MARTPVLAAGGIVLRQTRPPLIAVVRLRKGNEWVLPKGKLDDGETPRDAAMREVWEETGHDVSVHEFLGTLAYDAGGRSKIVHYWRMETSGRPTRDLMNDVSAVDWLPLKAAVERLSRDHERAFLANVGPLALEAASLAKRSQETKRSEEKKRFEEAKASAPAKRRRRRTVAAKPSAALAPSVTPLPDVTVPAIEQAQPPLTEHEAIGTGPSDHWAMPEMIAPTPEPFVAAAVPDEHASCDHVAYDSLPPQDAAVENKRQGPRVDLFGMVRAWLRRAA
jgi:8-oxo-dGTP diphosphatase